MKKIFDKEYSTQYNKEKDYLKLYGIDYEYIKIEKNITIYKYKKTQKLFQVLAKFYEGK